MKDPKFPKEIFAPTITPNELREHKRKMERALNDASEAIQVAREEFHYLVYGNVNKIKEIKN
uniref:Uncharacterized protein n=1 Tax=Candidatus Kentrum sp. TUN TaxID=2126343 RepID=A0A451AEH9_9GAMM|nr:MAG: hypothetical protein BECKTUN1418F_GA0071002_12395 [Candidatus Kentron sp. TUN]VFK64446.1 MAG: hypothetical protein BECKTUN1418D_GA0071000_12614 [Candidatus Kentron sp. TUN]VFK70192.1 MAG: hypothetical protein BECKTUN1418E_GA0071001_12435 [Candidatus Kentron sp. TUN]